MIEWEEFYMKVRKSKKVLVVLMSILLSGSCLLSACTKTNEQSTVNNPANNAPLELPDGYGYSWTRDTNFSSLSAEEQLELVNTAFIEEGFLAQVHSIDIAPNEDIYVSGAVTYGTAADIHGDSATYCALLVRYDKDLNLIKSLIVSDYGAFFTIGIDNNGYIYVEGTDHDGYTIVKYDAALNEVRRQETMPLTSLNSTVFSADGYLFMSGSIMTNIEEYSFSAIIAKYTTDLELVDYVTWDDDRINNFQKLAVASDNSVYAIGNAAAPNLLDFTAVLCKYDSNLELLQTVIKTKKTNLRFDDIAIGKDDSVFVLYDPGYTESARTNDTFEHIIIKYSANLDELCLFSSENVLSAETDSFQYFSCYLSSLAVDKNGFVYCAGTVEATTTNEPLRYYVIAIVLSEELSLLNISLCTVDKGFLVAGICLSDNADVYIAGSLNNNGTVFEPKSSLIIK